MILKVRLHIILITLSIATGTCCNGMTEIAPVGMPATLGSTIYSIDWSRCFIAAGGYDDDKSVGIVGIYHVKQTAEMICLLCTTTFGYDAFTIKWSPSSEFLAVGGDNDEGKGIVGIYSFDSTNTTIFEQVGSIHELDTFVNSIDWCPSGSYLAAGSGSSSFCTGGILQIYDFDCITGLVVNFKPIYFALPIKAIKWRDDGNYLAATDTRSTLYIYAFDETKGMTAAVLSATSSIYNSLDWCLNGTYIAAGGYENYSRRGIIDIYAFDAETTPSLVLITSKTIDTTDFQVFSLKWDRENNLVVCAAEVGSGDDALIQLYHFDKLSQQILLMRTYKVDFSFDTYNNFAASIALDPIGDCLAIGGLHQDQALQSIIKPAPIINSGIIQLYTSKVPKSPLLRAKKIINKSPLLSLVPRNLRAEKLYHRFPTQTDIANMIYWDAATDAVAYNIYADEALTILIAKITNPPLCFMQHQICDGKSTTYYVTAINAQGQQSEPAVVTI